MSFVVTSDKQGMKEEKSFIFQLSSVLSNIPGECAQIPVCFALSEILPVRQVADMWHPDNLSSNILLLFTKLAFYKPLKHEASPTRWEFW